MIAFQYQSPKAVDWSDIAEVTEVTDAEAKDLREIV
jgi:hypothetical protein